MNFLLKYTIGLFVMISGLNLHEANRKNLTKKPNIIFILSDDHTTNAISAYGGLYKVKARIV
ncbi:MAG: hypothetical protein L7T60_06695 [Flavobacteriaceae bacterium]|nr:hypothetical protein [Flavobacteriaceae bacterium]